MGRKSQFSPEARERAVRMVEEHRPEYQTQWDAICSIATMIGCSAESLRRWIKKERKKRVLTDGRIELSDKERIAQLECENRELRKANEIFRLASAYFAQAELDRFHT
jgi:transposase